MVGGGKDRKSFETFPLREHSFTHMIHTILVRRRKSLCGASITAYLRKGPRLTMALHWSMQANNVEKDLPTSGLYSSPPLCLGLIRGLEIQFKLGFLLMMPLAPTFCAFSVFDLAFRGHVSVTIGCRQAFQSNWTPLTSALHDMDFAPAFQHCEPLCCLLTAL